MNEPLTQKHCVPCEGGIPPATDEEIARLLPQVPGWEVREDDVDGVKMKRLHRRFKFEDFRLGLVIGGNSIGPI